MYLKNYLDFHSTKGSQSIFTYVIKLKTFLLMLSLKVLAENIGNNEQLLPLFQVKGYILAANLLTISSTFSLLNCYSYDYNIHHWWLYIIVATITGSKLLKKQPNGDHQVEPKEQQVFFLLHTFITITSKLKYV